MLFIALNGLPTNEAQLVNEPEKPEFWEASFREKQEMWGFEPAKLAVVSKDFFVRQGVKTILVSGIGYGRNAQIFCDSDWYELLGGVQLIFYSKSQSGSSLVVRSRFDLT